MRDRSDDPSLHDQTLLPLIYISLLLRKEGNVSLNNALNTLETLLPPLNGRLFPISSKGRYIGPDSTLHDFWYISREAREIAQRVHHDGSIRRPIAPRADALPRSYISLPQNRYQCENQLHRTIGRGQALSIETDVSYCSPRRYQLLQLPQSLTSIIQFHKTNLPDDSGTTCFHVPCCIRFNGHYKKNPPQQFIPVA